MWGNEDRGKLQAWWYVLDGTIFRCLRGVPWRLKGRRVLPILLVLQSLYVLRGAVRGSGSSLSTRHRWRQTRFRVAGSSQEVSAAIGLGAERSAICGLGSCDPGLGWGVVSWRDMRGGGGIRYVGGIAIGALIERLDASPGRHLVLAHYSPNTMFSRMGIQTRPTLIGPRCLGQRVPGSATGRPGEYFRDRKIGWSEPRRLSNESFEEYRPTGANFYPQGRLSRAGVSLTVQ